MTSLQAEHVDAFRRFNRFYTRQIGVLEQSLLGTPFTLTQARVLYELAQHKQTTAGQVNVTLGLDPGYLSRILQGFADQGLITRNRSREDSRHVVLSLTAAGKRAFRQLDRRSRNQAAALLSRMPPEDCGRMLHGMQCVQQVLDPGTEAAPPERIVIRSHQPGDLGWAIERHGRLYADEYGWNEEFEALVASLFAAFATHHDSETEHFWVAEVDGRRAGCVFVVRNVDDPSMAQLRCLLVDPSSRGLGVGQRLVEQCIDFARTAGYRGMTLWTNDVLVYARRIYEAAGFKLAKEDRHHSFGRDLVGQVWTMEF